jgi:hypothetical protein
MEKGLLMRSKPVELILPPSCIFYVTASLYLDRFLSGIVSRPYRVVSSRLDWVTLGEL